MRVSIPYWKRRKPDPNIIYIDPIVASVEILGHSFEATGNRQWARGNRLEEKATGNSQGFGLDALVSCTVASAHRVVTSPAPWSDGVGRG